MAIESPMASDPNSTAGFNSISRMAGSPAVPGQNPTGPDGSAMNAGGDPQAALASVTGVISGIEDQLTSLSKQFPQASNEIRTAIQAVHSVMMRVVSNPGGPEPAAPRGPLG